MIVLFPGPPDDRPVRFGVRVLGLLLLLRARPGGRLLPCGGGARSRILDLPLEERQGSVPAAREGRDGRGRDRGGPEPRGDRIQEAAGGVGNEVKN